MEQIEFCKAMEQIEFCSGDLCSRVNSMPSRFSLQPCTMSFPRVENLVGININKHLTDDLLLEIFCRLPCKFAIQCKSVCKLWHSIISKPCFARLLIGHQVKGNYQEGLSFHAYKKQFVILPQLPGHHVSLNFLPCFQGEQETKGCILSSCNDLLLCSSRGSDEAMYYVCNPFTKHWAAIPPAPLPYYKRKGVTPVGFICDPYYHVDNLGGVVMNPHSRFWILRAFGDSLCVDSVFDVDIFSSETWKWAKVKVVRQQMFVGLPKYTSTRAVSYNGRFYLQVGRHMVVFDPHNSEVCGEIDLPDLSQSRYLYEGFSFSCGSLWMCLLDNDVPRLSMWRLKDENERVQGQQRYWNLERQVTLSDLAQCTSLARQCLRRGRLVAIHPNNPDIVYVCFLSSVIIGRCPGNFVAWNLGTGTTHVVGQSLFGGSHSTRWDNMFFLDVPVWPSPVSDIPSHHDQ